MQYDRGRREAADLSKTAVRTGDARLVRDSPDAGRARPDRLPGPDHPEHHQ
ncbi:hypothetical protein AB0D11_03560 [Streptomyces monashensis]|uniref:hypothetical protein n=1 Tax=Streptomyces monashensis TaxID=1678012 RepID=UPI0034046300